MPEGGRLFKQIKADWITSPARRAEFCDLDEERRHFAETHLIKTHPEASCTFGLSRAQLAFSRRLFSIFGLLALITPALFWGIVSALFLCVFLALTLFRGLLIGAAVWTKMKALPKVQNSRQIWPIYTILIPVYREPRAIIKLIAALKGLDYPKRQLDIMILVEESDAETLQTLINLKLKPHFRIVPIPKGAIQTKPRALNYGLTLAKGQYVAVYDAEDEMRQSQLKDAVRAFQNDKAKSYACFQAPLVPHNGEDSWIASQFELEYLIHFGLIVPGLAALRAPVMLGGTSNHFRRDVLEEIGGWDPYNVTEDADLGLRLSAANYQIGVIAPPTFEEAPVTLTKWVRQRSRWIKGFIQTLGVYTRFPSTVIRAIGLWRWLASMLLLGGMVGSALLHGPMMLWLVACFLLPELDVPSVSQGLLGLAFITHILSSFLSLSALKSHTILAILSAPLYWPLQGLAAYKAVKELLRDPYYWDKTEHGLTERQLARSRLRSKIR